jgi:hypothetical protein
MAARSAARGRPDLFVEHLADPGDLRAGDPVDPERFDQIVDLARGHALHVGLDHDRVQRFLRPPAGLEERGEVSAGSDLGDPVLLAGCGVAVHDHAGLLDRLLVGVDQGDQVRRRDLSGRGRQPDHGVRDPPGADAFAGFHLTASLAGVR